MVCDEREISSVIKMLLKSSINRKEVSSRYIQYSLPDDLTENIKKKRNHEIQDLNITRILLTGFMSFEPAVDLVLKKEPTFFIAKRISI